jgi:hypothetical protein
MSWMLCHCGNIISDVDYSVQTEGHLIGFHTWVANDEKSTAQTADFLDAVRNQKREEWIERKFGSQYPQELSDAQIISDIWMRNECSLSVAECSQCGRLWIQTAPETNEYRSFSPDEPGYHRVLAQPEATEEAET